MCSTRRAGISEARSPEQIALRSAASAPRHAYVLAVIFVPQAREKRLTAAAMYGGVFRKRRFRRVRR